ncbi:MAG: phosphotransferase [Proteobacteria bacterium]|nr:phosphotransferase [Pseudomonadota bacterium]
MRPSSFFESRKDRRESFLSPHGWAGAGMHPVGADGSFRRYMRLRRGDEKSVILMEAVPDGSGMATPGHSLHDFIRIGAYLRSIGLHTPEIYAADEAEGYLLLEDFGDISFRSAMAGGEDAGNLYGLAADALIHMRGNADAGAVGLPDYYASHVHRGRRRVVDWYMPAARKERNADGIAGEYLAVWDDIEKNMPSCPQGFLHIDYHAENLMWMPGKSGLRRCGILDFQGAMRGPLPYDLANLLEDARAGVPWGVRDEMLARYCAGMKADEREIFQAWYRILAAQFHCRVIGQFIRLAVKDGKPQYLKHIPRVAGYLEEGLKHSLLATLRAWFDKNGVDFSRPPVFRAADMAGLIREDAF